MTSEEKPKQLLHLVFGGELERLSDVDFKDLDDLDIVGIFPDFESARRAWKAKAQQTVDNAHMRSLSCIFTVFSIRKAIEGRHRTLIALAPRSRAM